MIDSSILTDEKTSPAIGGNYSCDDYQTVLEKLVPELRCQADVVFVLAHIGPSQARELANVVPGIDVLIAGHDGVLLDPPVEVKDTLIGQASRKAKYIGEVSIELGNDNEVTGHSGSVKILDPDVKDDPDMLALVNDYKSKLKNPPTPTPSPTTDN